MICQDIRSTGQGGTVDPLVFPADQDLPERSELISVCERLSRVWKQRRELEDELLAGLELSLARTSDVPEALAVYQENARRRMQIVLENARRLFDEQLWMAKRFRASATGEWLEP